MAKSTIEDVARLAGVSKATVSRVLNESTQVVPEKRYRVFEAVKALRYKPNTQAKLLADRRSNSILLVHPISGPLTWYFHLLEAGVMRGCGKHAFQLVNHMVYPDSSRRMEKILEPLDRGDCHGVVLAAPFSDDPGIIEIIQKRHMPMVLIASGSETRHLGPGIGMDDEGAGYEMARYLLSLGHRRFGFVLGLKDHLSARERFVGVRRAMYEAGLTDDNVVSAEGGLDFPSGFSAFQRIIESGFKPTAIICANDEAAAGAIHAAHSRGLKLPDELSIVGFDDAPFAKLLSPPLTTISQSIDTMAARSIDILADVIRRVERRYETAKPRLVIRESAALCPSSNE